MESSMKLKLMLVILTVQILLYLYFCYDPGSKSGWPFFSHVNQSRPQVSRSDVAPLRILIWGPPDIGNWIALRDGYGGEGCPCYFTRDMTQVDDADAVVFVATVNDGEFSQMPPAKSRQNKNSQLRIFVSLESPHRMAAWWQKKVNITSMTPLQNSDQFNWTMTYRRDSDIHYNFYGITVKKLESSLTDLTTYDMSNHKLKFPPEKLTTYRDLYLPPLKKKLVAWTVSNCETVSRREDLVRELEKFVPVDIYGKCGNLTCPENNCQDVYKKAYKFYLSFENTLCYDYVTEKFFNALKSDVVPVVYGGANYLQLAPPGSYVDVKDFKSIKELADHLMFLDRNEEEYLKYFLWKEHFTFEVSYGWCELCYKMLSISNVQFAKRVLPNHVKSYTNISKWWFGTDEEPACKFPSQLLNFKFR